MKHPFFRTLIVTATVSVSACDRSSKDSPAVVERLRELEQERLEDRKERQELERELAAQKVAMEWEAIERERRWIEEAKQAVKERQAGQIPTETLESLRQRREDLVARELEAERLEAGLIKERARLSEKKIALDENELALAGREAARVLEAPAEPSAPIDEAFFDEALSPYGTWYESAEYGSVWQPAASSDPTWRPYTRGHWVCTDRGWTWMSSEPFGWATFHYGRWALLRNRGWIWVPGTEWAPSWCTWRSGDSHVGWAPLPPETMAYPYQNWDSRVEVQYGIGTSSFCFVETRYFDRPIAEFCLPAIQNVTCVSVTNNITNIQIVNQQVFCGGPAYLELSIQLNRPLPYYRIERERESFDRPNLSQLRSRVRGDRLIVAAPEMGNRTPRAGRIVKPRPELGAAEVERTASADPERIKAFRPMRERPVARETRGPVTERPLVAESDRERPTVTPRPAPLKETREVREARERPGTSSVDRPRENGKRLRTPERPGVVVPERRPGDKIVPPVTRPSVVREREERVAKDRERVRKETAANQAEGIQKEKTAREDALRWNRREEMTRREDSARKETAEKTVRQREEARQTQLVEAKKKQEGEIREQAERVRKQRAEIVVREEKDARQRASDDQRKREQAKEKEQAEMRKRQTEEAARRQEKVREEQAARQREERQQKQREAEEARRRQTDEQRKMREEAQQRQQEEARNRQQQEEERGRQEKARQQQEQNQRSRQEEQQQQQRQRQTERPKRSK